MNPLASAARAAARYALCGTLAVALPTLAGCGSRASSNNAAADESEIVECDEYVAELARCASAGDRRVAAAMAKQKPAILASLRAAAQQEGRRETVRERCKSGHKAIAQACPATPAVEGGGS